jgi:hypothetical protein
MPHAPMPRKYKATANFTTKKISAQQIFVETPSEKSTASTMLFSL